MWSGSEVREVKLYSRLVCAQKRQKCKFLPRLLSMIVVDIDFFTSSPWFTSLLKVFRDVVMRVILYFTCLGVFIFFR